MKRNILGATSLFVLLIFIDQFSKNIIRRFDGFYICNKGIAFGLNLAETFFWLIWLIIFGATLYCFFKSDDYRYPLSLIIAGAVANMMDRMQFGCVIDFIDIKIFNYPLFNLADTFIVIGAIILIVQSFKVKK